MELSYHIVRIKQIIKIWLRKLHKLDIIRPANGSPIRRAEEAVMQRVLISFLAIVSTSLNVWMGARYCAKIVRGVADSRTATWIIFELGVVMSLITYLTGSKHSLLSGINNVVDAFVVTVILTTLLLTRRGEAISFLPNERLCFWIAGAALVVWVVTRTSWVGIVGFQIMMFVGYFPTIKHILQWEERGAPEPAETWTMNAIAASLGALIAIITSDYVAMLYPLRGAAMCLTIVILIKRCERKNSHGDNSQA